VASLQCSLFICKDWKLKGFEVGRIRKDLKRKTVTKIEGFEVQNAYLEIGRIQHTCELIHSLKKLGDLFLSSG
jgi:hypothetical protein